MRIAFIINTPGQAHTWKNVIRRLNNDGHQTSILARDYGSTPVILAAAGLPFETFSLVGSRATRLLSSFRHFQVCYRFARSASPSLVIGFGIDAAFTAARLRKPAVVFIDDDHTPFQNYLTRLCGAVILTPDCFNGDLGRKHILVPSYKELAYIHPNYFQPDPSVLEELGVRAGEKYAILRFNVLDAVHDIRPKAVRGFSEADKMQLIERLQKHARVFISPEGPLPDRLEPYRLPIAYSRFHHALAYAHLFVADTGTATVEAALLGTPAVLCSPQAVRMGNFQDLSRRGLLCLYGDAPAAIAKSVELVQTRAVKEQWANRRALVLADRADMGRYLADFISHYPQSLKELPSLQPVAV